MNIRVSRAKRIEIEERKKKKYLRKILFIKKKRNEETSLAKIIRNNTLTLRVEFLSKTRNQKKKKTKYNSSSPRPIAKRSDKIDDGKNSEK